MTLTDLIYLNLCRNKATFIKYILKIYSFIILKNLILVRIFFIYYKIYIYQFFSPKQCILSNKVVIRKDIFFDCVYYIF